MYNKRSSPIKKWLCNSFYKHTKLIRFSFTYNPTSYTIYTNYTSLSLHTLCLATTLLKHNSLSYGLRIQKQQEIKSIRVLVQDVALSYIHLPPEFIQSAVKLHAPTSWCDRKAQNEDLFLRDCMWEMRPCSVPGRQIGPE